MHLEREGTAHITQPANGTTGTGAQFLPLVSQATLNTSSLHLTKPESYCSSLEPCLMASEDAWHVPRLLL